MKTYKPNTYGFAIKSFGLQNKLYLTTTVQVFFDLTAPDTLLTEQELWSVLPVQLGSDAKADMGFPKPHGELLVTGSCFALNDGGTQASDVQVSIGELSKRLLVFGERRWLQSGVPSRPEPFVRMPISWRNSYGGSGYEKNPIGKGYTGKKTVSGEVFPLPNIENPSHLVGSPADTTEPAGFAPLDMMWPQRFGKCGTYDKKWLEERWPWFPDNFNSEFFNTAPSDQYLSGFFQGEEPIEIRNMHPSLPLIRSQLPGQRPRVFLTRKKSLAPDAETEFVEVHHQIDTVWLFPSVLRGLVLYRGTLEVLDDEYGDIERIYVAAEKMSEEAKSIEHYWEEQKKFWDRSVEIDMAPLEKARGKIAAMLKKMRQLPKKIEHNKQKAMGKAPRMRRSPEEMAANAKKTLENSGKVLDEQEAMARRMHAQYGHLVAIDLGIFDRMRQQITKVGAKVEATLAKANKVIEEGAATKKKMSQTIKEKIPADQLAQAGIDPDDLLPAPKVNSWHDHGFPLVIQWRKNLEKNDVVNKQLAELGFHPDAIKSGWLGVNEKEYDEKMADWGETATDVSLPSSLVMPRFLEATLVSVCLRQDLRSGKDDLFIPGSQAPPLLLPSLQAGCPVIIVGDELQARLIEQEIGDCCTVLVLKDPADMPDDAGKDAVENSSAVRIVVLENSAGNAQDWDSWQKVFPKARPVIVPAGTDLYDVHRQTGLRPWLMQTLPEEIAALNIVDITLPAPGKLPSQSPVAGLAIPRFDVKTMVKQFSDELKQHHQPMIDEMQVIKKEAEAKARAALLAAGKDPDELLGKNVEPYNLAKIGKSISEKLIAQRDQLKSRGKLDVDKEGQMTLAAAEALKLGSDGEQRYQQGMQRLAVAREEIARIKKGEIPDNLKATFAAKGMDPDKLKKLTREEVQARHEQGLGMAGSNLSGLDLSELDLTGIDLSQANCRKTNFTKCILQGARLHQTIAMEADFSEADLANSLMDKALLNKTKFGKANLQGCEVRQALMKEADFTEASFEDAQISMSILQKAILINTNLTNVKADMSVFSDAKASGVCFAGARLEKCLFKRTVLDGADFSGAALPSTMLHGAQGTKVSFKGADLTKARMAGNAQFPGADFTGVVMENGCFLDSNLEGADFTGVRMQSSMIENCNMSKTKMGGISAQQCRFKRSNFEKADLRGVNLMGGSLKKARLVGTDLRDANLFAVDFFKSVMGETLLGGANLKRTLLYKRTEYLK